MTKTDHQLSDGLPNYRSELAGVPYVEEFFNAWAMWEPSFNSLLSYAETINLQLHLEQHAPEARARDDARRMGLSVTRDGIAVIELRGTLMKQESSFSAGTSTVLARRQIRAAAADEDVAGILLVVDSPGGTVAGTADLAADIRAANNKKPGLVHIHIEDLGASAALWLAVQGERITAGPTALVGSIGVFSVVTDLKAKADAEGRTVHVIKFGALKGAGIPGTEITEGQLAVWQARVDAFGEDFVAAVASGRKMSVERARSLASGEIWKGEAAVAVGLIDKIESLDDTLAALVTETQKTQPRSKPRSFAMLTDEAVATEQLPTATLEEKAATLQELKEALPAASSDFLLDQLEHKATLSEALKSNAKALAEANAKLTNENEQANAKLVEAEVKAAARPKRGSAPLANATEAATGDETHGDAGDQFRAKVEEKVAGGVPRSKAVAAVAKRYPELREQMVAEANR